MTRFTSALSLFLFLSLTFFLPFFLSFLLSFFTSPLHYYVLQSSFLPFIIIYRRNNFKSNQRNPWSKVSHTTHPIGLTIIFSFLLSFPFLSPVFLPNNILFRFTLRTSHHITSHRIASHHIVSHHIISYRITSIKVIFRYLSALIVLLTAPTNHVQVEPRCTQSRTLSPPFIPSSPSFFLLFFLLSLPLCLSIHSNHLTLSSFPCLFLLLPSTPCHHYKFSLHSNSPHSLLPISFPLPPFLIFSFPLHSIPFPLTITAIM